MRGRMYLAKTQIAMAQPDGESSSRRTMEKIMAAAIVARRRNAAPPSHRSQPALLGRVGDSGIGPGLRGSGRRFRAGRSSEKIRETKVEPTMLLIIKDRFSEPTMFMKINRLTLACHDIYENKVVV
jgi:hypothetical protein